MSIPGVANLRISSYLKKTIFTYINDRITKIIKCIHKHFGSWYNHCIYPCGWWTYSCRPPLMYTIIYRRTTLLTEKIQFFSARIPKICKMIRWLQSQLRDTLKNKTNKATHNRFLKFDMICSVMCFIHRLYFA